jgi:UDP:flavonoid glycosyltransferase YjiC (YdhE family)
MSDTPLVFLSAGIMGSTGDIRPLMALALALRARGFEILVEGDRTFEPAARAAGVATSEWFSSSAIPQGDWLRTEAGQRGLWGKRLRRRDRWIREQFAVHRVERMARLRSRIGGWDNPRLAAAVVAVPAFQLLWQFGPRCAKVISCPMPYQSSARLLLPPDASLLQRIRVWRQERAQHAEQRRFREELFHFVSASPTIFPRPDDWLPNMQVTGYVPLDDEAGWGPPAPLVEFLRDGPPPIYVGFGSHAVLVGARGRRRAERIVEACRRSGVRCILQSPDSPVTASREVFTLRDHVPHAWLFPCCAAMVHHGGYGTIHAALAARRPMIVYPFQTDQFLWARRVGELGVGPGFTARLECLSTTRLERDLAFVLRRECQENAALVGALIAGEQGLRVQVAAIESAIGHTRRGRAPLQWQLPAMASTPPSMAVHSA